MRFPCNVTALVARTLPQCTDLARVARGHDQVCMVFASALGLESLPSALPNTHVTSLLRSACLDACKLNRHRSPSPLSVLAIACCHYRHHRHYLSPLPLPSSHLNNVSGDSLTLMSMYQHPCFSRFYHPRILASSGMRPVAFSLTSGTTLELARRPSVYLTVPCSYST